MSTSAPKYDNNTAVSFLTKFVTNKKVPLNEDQLNIFFHYLVKHPGTHIIDAYKEATGLSYTNLDKCDTEPLSVAYDLITRIGIWKRKLS